MFKIMNISSEAIDHFIWEHGFEPDFDEETDIFHERCYCGAFLSQKTVEVPYQIPLEEKEVWDEKSEQMIPIVTKWDTIQTPMQKCNRCGELLELKY